VLQQHLKMAQDIQAESTSTGSPATDTSTSTGTPSDTGKQSQQP
jgi:hypothetical protein